MKLPLHLLDSPALFTGNADELISALGGACNADEADEIKRLVSLGLPPITSLKALAVMTGLNPGFLWSMAKKPHRHYRVFHIPKGRDTRQIEAPRVALKFIQKWLSIHFERKWTPHAAVHGFVKGRSHLTSAQQHLGAEWVISLDIKNFFPSTPAATVRQALVELGYQTDESLNILQALCCFHGRLSQGAPTSPTISNICLQKIDEEIDSLASQRQITYTRYADDLVLSGKGNLPTDIIDMIKAMFIETPWQISERKIFAAQLPQRLKVHGLLVHGDSLRLTKGYRNRIRAFKHLYSLGNICNDDIRKISGHLNYAHQVERFKVDNQ